jgi:hypothetical protein
MWVHGTMSANLEGEGKCFKKWKSAFWKKGDIMVQVWKDKWRVKDKYDPWGNNCKHRVERKENKHGNKELYAAVQHNKFTKDIDRAVRQLSFYSVLWKTV